MLSLLELRERLVARHQAEMMAVDTVIGLEQKLEVPGSQLLGDLVPVKVNVTTPRTPHGDSLERLQEVMEAEGKRDEPQPPKEERVAWQKVRPREDRQPASVLRNPVRRASELNRRETGKWTLPNAIVEVMEGMRSFTTGEARVALEKKFPEKKQAIVWGISNALRRLEDQGKLTAVINGRNASWQWKPAAEVSRQSEALLKEIHGEIEAAKPSKD